MQEHIINLTIASFFSAAFVWLQWRVTGFYTHSLQTYKRLALLNLALTVGAFLVSVFILYDWITAFTVFILFVSTIGWQLVLYIQKLQEMTNDQETENFLSAINHRLSEDL